MSLISFTRSARNRDFYLDAGREYVRRFGEDQLVAAAWNPAAAKRGGRPDLLDRYRAGRDDGSQWPSLNAVKKAFGGFVAFRAALGLPPNTTGGPRRRPGEAEPIFNVFERRVVVPAPVTAALRRQLEKAERRALRAEERLEEAKAQAKARVVEVPVVDERKITELRERLADERARRKDAQRDLFNAERREARARERERAARAIARASDPNAMREVERLTDRLADAQVRVRELEDSVRTGTKAPAPRPEVITKTKTVEKIVKVRDESLLRTIELAEAKVKSLRAELTRVEGLRAEDAERLATIRADAMARAAADARVGRAERRAAEVEAKMAELAELAVGQRRQLTSAEVADLRRTGPAGEALLTAALRNLRRARLEGGRAATKVALRELASAALTWGEKL